MPRRSTLERWGRRPWSWRRWRLAGRGATVRPSGGLRDDTEIVRGTAPWESGDPAPVVAFARKAGGSYRRGPQTTLRFESAPGSQSILKSELRARCSNMALRGATTPISGDRARRGSEFVFDRQARLRTRGRALCCQPCRGLALGDTKAETSRITSWTNWNNWAKLRGTILRTPIVRNAPSCIDGDWPAEPQAQGGTEFLAGTPNLTSVSWRAWPDRHTMWLASTLAASLLRPGGPACDQRPAAEGYGAMGGQVQLLGVEGVDCHSVRGQLD